ncbi:hypothetical protein BJ944DRAFT_251988 [Cunninghamella echinulata]|nr:hypothetical protein BJ944DRAFT_251988 [Cunninghamella echinulata]
MNILNKKRYESSIKKMVEDDLVNQLITLFPNGDPDYFRYCITFYDSNHVERITEKIFNSGGYYPQLPKHIKAENHVDRWNAALTTLATDLFPDTDIDYLRRLILNHQHSYIEQVTLDLLSDVNVPERLDYKQLHRYDMFRSDHYKTQALQQLITEFPQVWKSSICAVLAENNWDYIKSYDQLSEMGSGGFWSSIRNFFLHFSMPKAGSSPSFPSSSSHSSSSSSITSLQQQQQQKEKEKGTIMDPILLKEIQQIQKRKLDKQVLADETIAHEINIQEYEANEQFIECGCCFGDYTFEQLIFCSQGKHQFCHHCIQQFLSEGLFGQGNLRGAVRIPCIASDDRFHSCDGCFTMETLKECLSMDLWKAYEASLLEANLAMQGWALVRCASCNYSELDESTRPFHQVLDKTQLFMYIASWIMVLLLLLFIIMIDFVVIILKKIGSGSGSGEDDSVVIMLNNNGLDKNRLNKMMFDVNNHPFLFTLLFLLFGSLLWFGLQQWDLKNDLHIAYDRIVQQRRGYAFQCRNPSCGKLTCLKCMHVIRGLHSCWENEKDGLRLYVEKAMADAVKRTCPKCNVSFQKSDGCNKIVCQCGYTMCYVCRKDIKKESYAHFCQHFRDLPGSPCSKCKKCDLYKTTPEDQAVKKAANNARREYLEAHPDVARQIPLDDIIGPKSTLNKIDEWKHESIIWFLQSGMNILV